MKAHKKVRFIIKYVIYSLSLMYSASKVKFVIMLFSNIALGALSSLIIVTYKYLIDGIEFYIKKSAIAPLVFIKGLIFYSLIKLLIRIVTQANDYYSFQYFNELDKFFTVHICNKISKLKMERFDDPETYDLIQIVYKDSTSKNKMMLDIIMDLVRNMVTMLSLSYLIIRFSVVCFFVCIISSILIIFNEFSALEKLYNEYNKQIESIRFIEMLKNLLIKYNWIVETKIYNTSVVLINKMKEIYSNNLKNNKAIKLKFFKQSIFISILEEIISTLNILLVVFKSYKLNISIGSTIMYFQTLNLLRQSFTNLFSSIESSYESCLYIEKYFSLMKLEEDNRGKITLGEKIKRISFNDVYFKYPKSTSYALKKFDYTFELGKTYGIVGLNGSGKTTLIKLILGIYEPTHGNIYVNNNLINCIKKTEYYKFFDIVNQEFIKYPFSLRENISIGSSQSGEYNLADDLDIEKIFNEINKSNVDKDITIYNYDKILDKRIDGGIELSGGQWQKVAIARALYKRSEILILDEPTSSIDSLTEQNIFDFINKEKDDKINIIVTHRLKNLKHVDDIILLDNGNMLAHGTHSQLKNNSLYKELYNSQVHISD